MWNQVIETLSKEPGILLAAILGTLGIVLGCTIGAIAIITDAWRRVRQTEDNNALKQSMLDRGMTADEIATVIGAGQKPRPTVRISRGGFRACG